MKQELETVVDLAFTHIEGFGDGSINEKLRILIDSSSGKELNDNFFEFPRDEVIIAGDYEAVVMLKYLPDCFGSPGVYVDKFFVAPGSKGKGVGKKLAQYVMEHVLKQKDDLKLFLRCDSENDEANAFYGEKWFVDGNPEWMNEAYASLGKKPTPEQLVVQNRLVETNLGPYQMFSVGLTELEGRRAEMYIRSMPSSFKQ